MSPDQCTVKEAPSAARPAPIAPSNWRISFASTVIDVFPLRGTLPLGAIRELNGTSKVGNSGMAYREQSVQREKQGRTSGHCQELKKCSRVRRDAGAALAAFGSK